MHIYTQINKYMQNPGMYKKQYKYKALTIPKIYTQIHIDTCHMHKIKRHINKRW